MSELIPPVEPYESGLLPVTDGHSLYWETVGDRDGLPAVYLHGGPGSGSTLGARRYFDTGSYRAVLFDQRGSGRSRPLADDPADDLSTNTTAHLIDDLDRLREHLGISWGVTLGLAYAQRHPERVIAMVLGAVTAGTRLETDWITRDMGRVFPREWERFASIVPVSEREGDLAAAYARLLADPDPQVRVGAAREWCLWEDTHVSLMPGWTPSPRYQNAAFRMIFARLVTHYWSNGCFLAEGQILSNLHRLANVPAVLIHGRFDVSSPLDTAWRLHRAWPGSELVVIEDAGHGGGSFPGALVEALQSFAALR
jgi:proline iminopeptidase